MHPLLIGEHVATRGGQFRFSPFLFPQSPFFNRFLLPKQRDLPYIGLTFALKTFDFGFNASNPSLAPFDTAYQTVVCIKNFLVWGITGVVTPLDGSAAVSPAFLFQFLHSHKDSNQESATQRQWFAKPISDVEGLGTAEEPLILKEPQLVLAGDQLQIQIQNLSGAIVDAQVCLLGGEF